MPWNRLFMGSDCEAMHAWFDVLGKLQPNDKRPDALGSKLQHILGYVSVLVKVATKAKQYVDWNRIAIIDAETDSLLKPWHELPFVILGDRYADSKDR
jgi:VanZ family protein